MDTPSTITAFISTQTAAMLTGKSVRTIHNWLESGAIDSKQVAAERIPGGMAQRINLLSMAAYIPFDLTDDFAECVVQADAGEANGALNVGTYFYKVGQHKIAVDWFESAAKKGNSDAMDLLSHCYIKGVGVDKNFAVGVQWLGKAAELGHMMAKVKINDLMHQNEELERKNKTR